MWGLKNSVTGLYNLHAENYKICNIATMIQNLVPNTKVVFQEMKFEDARNYRVTSDKIRAQGWAPKFSMDQGIMEIYNTIKEGRLKNVRDEVYSNEHYLRTLKTNEWVLKGV